MTIRDYSTTPASNNAAPPNGWPEGQSASTVNDCARQMMAEIRESFEELPYFDFGDDPTRVDNDTFSLVGDLTARYPVGARVKLVGATTGTGRITASAFGAVTTIDVVMDSGNVPTSLVRVAVQPSSGSSETPTSVSLTASGAGTSVGLSRADHIHALSQSIAPTWTDLHTFSKTATNINGSLLISAALPMITIRESDASANNGYWQWFAQAEQMGLIAVNDANNASGTIMTVDRTGATVDSVTFPSDGASNKLIVGTTSAVSGGLMKVRSTSVAAAYLVTSAGAATSAANLQNEATAGDNVFATFITETGAGTARGSISYNRGGGLVAYNTTSDERLKDNIRDSLSALGLIGNIRVRAFDWKNMPGSAQRYWLVAQEVALVMPEAVSIPEREEDSWSIDVSKLVPLAIKGMQEQQQQIQQLLARVAALESGGIEVKPR